MLRSVLRCVLRSGLGVVALWAAAHRRSPSPKSRPCRQPSIRGCLGRRSLPTWQVSPVPPAVRARGSAALSLYQRFGAAEGRALAVGTPPRCALSLAARNQPPGLNQPRLWNPPWMSSVDVLSEFPQSLDRRQPASSSRISPVVLAAPAPSHQTASATSSGWITSSRAARSNHWARCWA